MYKIIWRDNIKGSLNIGTRLSMKVNLVDPNLLRTFFGNNFFDPNYGEQQLLFDAH